MKRNPDFLIKNVAGKQVLVPVGQAAVSFPGMVTVNDTGKYIWELLETEQTLDSVAEAIACRYDVPLSMALEDAGLFLDRLMSVKAIIE